MSILLARSHFIKHLAFIHPVRRPQYLIPPRTFSSTKTTFRNRNYFQNLNSITAPFSTSSTTASETSTIASYLSVDIRCRKDVSDVLSEALLCFGASSTSMDEQENGRHDDEISITSIFPLAGDVHQSISQAAVSIGLEETPDYKVTVGYQSDWIEQNRESFQAVEVTDGLWIVPEWSVPPDLQATNIILNPGLAFGTGDHPTTKLCLLLLHDFIKGGEVLLDYGTGSGILAIAALKFGAASSVGVDIDPQAITAACHNAALNNIGPEKLQLYLIPGESDSHWATESVEGQKVCGAGTIPGKEKYDIVIANILLNPLLDLADHIVSYAKPGAVVGVSGIISEQVPAVVERYSQLLEDIRVSKIEDWACVTGNKIRELATGKSVKR